MARAESPSSREFLEIRMAPSPTRRAAKRAPIKAVKALRMPKVRMARAMPGSSV